MLLLESRLLTIVAGGLLLFSLYAHDRHLMILGSGFLVIGCMLIIAQWVSASHAGCPLGRTPVLAPMRCMKHRRARSMLGSYRLKVALAIMFTERFRCPYCNESTALNVGVAGCSNVSFMAYQNLRLLPMRPI